MAHQDELPRAQRALETLGGVWRQTRDVSLRELPNRNLVVFEQLRPAPDAHPPVAARH